MATTREIKPCDLEMVRDYLAANLRIAVQTTSEYVGINDGPPYKDRHTVLLLLDGDVISEISF